jgi:hypothetical protein
VNIRAYMMGKCKHLHQNANIMPMSFITTLAIGIYAIFLVFQAVCFRIKIFGLMTLRHWVIDSRPIEDITFFRNVGNELTSDSASQE